MAPQTFPNITPERFERLKTQAVASGFVITGDTGKAVVHSPLGKLDMEYSYDRAGNILTIHCTDKPRFAPEHTITSEIEHLISATA